MEVERFKHRQLAPTVGPIVTIIGRIRRTFIDPDQSTRRANPIRSSREQDASDSIAAYLRGGTNNSSFFSRSRTLDQHQDQSEDVKYDFYQELVSAWNSVGPGLLLIKLAAALVKIRSNL
jgi:hypothetical protein